MLVVMPLGYAFPNVARDLFKVLRDPATQRPSMAKFNATVVDELIPQVERAYRVARDRDSRHRRPVDGRRPGALHRLQPPRPLRLGRLFSGVRHTRTVC